MVQELPQGSEGLSCPGRMCGVRSRGPSANPQTGEKDKETG